MSDSRYDIAFYAQRDAETRFAAETVIDAVLRLLPPVRSAVDVGCGVGTWLSVLKTRGVADILGVEGSWVQTDRLQIPKSSFHEHDLCQPLRVARRFDLAISLEVAEHLPNSAADRFVESLVRLSDLVLFAAAIPGQGGTHHVNERWPAYWETLFAQHKYVGLDIIRREIWNEDRIPRWYRQNTVLFVANSRLPDIRLDAVRSVHAPIPLVHPETFAHLRDAPVSVARALYLLRQAVVQGVARRFRRK